MHSTVYLGVTEEVVKPILERESGMRCGVDFKIGYSPERINPGDEEHPFNKIKKTMNDSPILVDVRGMFDQEEVWERGFYYRSLC